MTLTVGDLAEALGAEAQGDLGVEITGAAEPSRAGPADLAVALSPGWAEALAEGQARAALLWPGADWKSLGLRAALFAPRGRLAMARVTRLLDQPPFSAGVHPTAVIHPSVRLGTGIGVGALCVLGEGAEIADGTRLGPQVTVGRGVRIGPDGVIHPGARIGREVAIGARVVIQPNAVIGADGFSFVTESPSNVEVARETMGQGTNVEGGDPTWHKVHSLGGVEIGDDVEIGSGSAIDAGTLRPTRIGDGTKIDNLVQVGHNVVIGRHCLLCGQVAIGGSTRIGDRVVLGGAAGINDNIVIGDDVVVTGGSGVVSNVPAGRVVMGNPAVRMDLQLGMYKALRRLPRVLRNLAAGVPKGS